MIKPFPKRKGQIGDVTELQQNSLSVAALFTVNRDGSINQDSRGKFLLNPSSINESKSANWNPQSTPGQSDPVLQWLSNGPRIVTFQALVTAETSDLTIEGLEPPNKPPQNSGDLGKVFNGTIASAFAKVIDPPPLRRAVGSGQVQNFAALDISILLNYYRSLMYPVYDNVRNPKTLQQSPPLLVFLNGSTVAKFSYGSNSDVFRIHDNHDVWVLTNLRIKITKQTPNLAPMEATVDFELTQYNIKSFDRRRFLG